jgi:hypothetical protein
VNHPQIDAQNSTFLNDYQACLDCAGPSNQDIWQYYGGTLSGYGQSCGLSTTPVSNTSTTTNSTSSLTLASSTELPQSYTTTLGNATTSVNTGTSSSGSPSASVGCFRARSNGIVLLTETQNSALVPVSGTGSTSKSSFYGVFVLAFGAMSAGLV